MDKTELTLLPPLVEQEEVLNEDKTSIKHNELLAQLLEQIDKIDFREKAELRSSENIKQKHYLICISEHLLELAKDNKWGLCKYNECIYLYNGQYWNFLEKDEIMKFLSDSAEQMGTDKYDAKHYSFVKKLYEQFLFSSNFQKPKIQIDKVLINLKNGTFEIDWSGFKLREFNAVDFLTYQLNFNYSPKAECPKFYKYLNRVLPDLECQYILAEYLAYVFTKHLKLEKCLLLYGSGANGKSVFFEIVNALLGEENVSNYSLESLSSDYYRSNLANKLINYGSEIKGNITADTFKQLASGEPIEARLPYGQPFTLKHYAKLMFNCNELPKDVEHNEAYFRRFLIIPFNVTIPKNERNPNLANEIIKEELAGVFNWVMEGLARLLENNKFSQSVKVSAMIDKYKNESDNVKLFLDTEKYISSATNYKPLKDFYFEYRMFCSDGGYSPLNRTNFKRRLESLKFSITRKKVGLVIFLEKE